MSAITDSAAAAQAKKKPARRKRARTGAGIYAFEVLTDNFLFKNFILLCIVVNSVILGYDAHFGPENSYHSYIDELDDIFLLIFTGELILEFLAAGPSRYFKNGWNLFDCAVVGASYLSAVPGITALRTFRVLRVLRLVSNVPQMRRVVEALIGAMPGILATFMVLFVVFYIGAVMATTLFRGEEGFGDLGQSALTLFQLTLFDDWGATVARLDEVHPWAWAFIVGFTMLSAFAVLNLFIGVIVDAIQETRTAEIREDVADIEEDVDKIEENVEGLAEAQEDAVTVQKSILEEIRAMRAEFASIKAAREP